MIRTKHVLIAVALLVGTLLGIVITVLFVAPGYQQSLDQLQPTFVQDVREYGAVESSDMSHSDVRESLIEKLRVYEGDDQLEEDDVVDVADVSDIESDTFSNRTVAWCRDPDSEEVQLINGASFNTWPNNGAKETIIEGARLYTTSLFGQSTTSTTTTRTLLQLPIAPVQNSVQSCLESIVVGVTTDGTVIGNNDAYLFTNFSETDLVGYALDGFPIYGSNIGAELDACGGVNSADGYRYHISESENSVISCFMGTPQRMLFLAPTYFE